MAIINWNKIEKIEGNNRKIWSKMNQNDEKNEKQDVENPIISSENKFFDKQAVDTDAKKKLVCNEAFMHQFYCTWSSLFKW